MTIPCGLDFGTTNSAISVNKKHVVKIINIEPQGPFGKTIRSAIYFNENGQVSVGQEAIANYIEEGAMGRLMQSIKTFLPSKTFKSTIANGRSYQIDDLISIILKKMKQRAEITIGKEVDSVVMGRPVVFSKNHEEDHLAEERLRSAAEKSGFRYIGFQFEPVAAALTFEQTLNEQGEQKVFVGDFGGGTSDFTVVKLSGSGHHTKLDRKKDILSLRGVSIGGDTFDSRIMWHRLAKYFGLHAKFKTMTGQWLEVPRHIFLTLCQWHLIPQLRDRKTLELIRRIKANSNRPETLGHLENLITDNYGYMLFQAIEKAKCGLSSKFESTITFADRALMINEVITRNEFEEMVHSGIAQVRKCVDETLNDAELNPQEIDAIFLTGGSSCIPCVRNIFLEKFGKEKIREADVFTSVVYGLGLAASSL